MTKLYKDLTGININDQIELWDERGKGYYGEFLVFQELYKYIIGKSKILMNLQIPAPNGKTTEIDLLLIHETGLYVFEIKHFKGTIYGDMNETYWTQYFRTAPNHKFRNPFKQNKYHIDILQEKYPSLPIHSFVVFTSTECDLRIDGILPNATLSTLRNLYRNFIAVSTKKEDALSSTQINSLFCELKEYSPYTKQIVFAGENPIQFYDYIDIMLKDYREGIEQNKKDCLELVKIQNKKTKKTIFSAIIVCIIFVLGAISICNSNEKECTARILAAEQELAVFAHKFEHVEEFNNGEITFSEDLIIVSDVVLENSSDVENTINFSCSLKWIGTNYGVCIREDTQIIVILNDGTVKEYDLWNRTYPFTSNFRLGGSVLQSTGKIAVHEFYDIELSDISYIKLSNLSVWKINAPYSNNEMFDGYEIELYDANKIPISENKIEAPKRYKSSEENPELFVLD